jgi:hypothetical protein
MTAAVGYPFCHERGDASRPGPPGLEMFDGVSLLGA